MGKTTRGRLGLGFGSEEGNTRWDKADANQRRKMITNELREMEEENRKTKAVGMASQGAWLKWECAINRKLTWGDM